MRAAQALANGMKRLRRELGLTQADLAEAAEVHVQYISQTERQKRAPSLETIDAIAAALGVTAAQLLARGEGDEKATAAAPKDRVARLLAAWPGKDQKRLVELLIELRKIVGRGSRSG